jgi:holin-like protein
VPIAVGLMAYGTLIRQHGVALALVLLVSTAAGLATAAWIGSWLIPPKESFQLET